MKFPLIFAIIDTLSGVCYTCFPAESWEAAVKKFKERVVILSDGEKDPPGIGHRMVIREELAKSCILCSFRFDDSSFSIPLLFDRDLPF